MVKFRMKGLPPPLFKYKASKAQIYILNKCTTNLILRTTKQTLKWTKTLPFWVNLVEQTLVCITKESLLARESEYVTGLFPSSRSPLVAGNDR